MKLVPRNKHLVLEVFDSEVKQEEKISEFFNPSTKRPDNLIYRVIAIADDSTLDIEVRDLVLIEGNMVNESKIGQQVFLTCKENFVLGIIRE